MANKRGNLTTTIMSGTATKRVFLTYYLYIFIAHLGSQSWPYNSMMKNIITINWLAIIFIKHYLQYRLFRYLQYNRLES